MSYSNVLNYFCNKISRTVAFELVGTDMINMRILRKFSFTDFFLKTPEINTERLPSNVAPFNGSWLANRKNMLKRENVNSRVSFCFRGFKCSALIKNLFVNLMAVTICF